MMTKLHRWALIALSVLLCCAFACGESKPKTAVSNGQEDVLMRLRDDRVESRGSVFVSFERRSGDPKELSLSPALSLMKDEETLNLLLVRSEGNFNRYPAVIDVDDAIPTLALAARPDDFYRFELPSLEAGAYALCAAYSLDERQGRVCADITVT